MAIKPVQNTSNIAHSVVPANNTIPVSITGTFPNNNTAGNTVCVWVFLNQSGAGVGNDTPVLKDNLGNTYSFAFASPPGGNNNGAGCWFYFFTAPSGSNAVVFHINLEGGFTTSTFEYTILSTEYSGMPSPSLQDHDNVDIFGSSGNSPSVLTITDSLGASVSVTYKTAGAPGSNGIGTVNTGAGLVDILSGGVDYLIGAVIGNTNGLIVPTTSPAGYETFVLEQLASDVTNGYYGYYWDAGPSPTSNQPRVQILT